MGIGSSISNQSPNVLRRALAATTGTNNIGSSLGNITDELENIKGINLARLKENEFLTLASGNVNGLAIRKTQTGYFVFRHLGGDNWLEYALTNSGEIAAGVNTPWKITSQRVFKIQGYISVNDMTASGGWSDIATLNPSSYTGYFAKQSAVEGSTLSQTVTSKGDLFFIFTSRTSGGIASISINGGTAFDVDTYSSADLQNKQAVKIANNLPQGNHTVLITVTARRNAASTGFNILAESLRIDDKSLRIDSDYTKPRFWTAGAVYASREEVKAANGRYYINQFAGTAGQAEPNHSGGTVSDGGIDWTLAAVSTYGGAETQVQVFGSELEYAYEFKLTELAAMQDIGGNIHGREFVRAISLHLDGTPLTMTDGEIRTGVNLSIVQDLTDYVNDYATRTDVATIRQIHDFSNSCMQVRATGQFIASGFIGFYYSSMLPFLTYYGGIWATRNFRKFYTPQVSLDLKDYENLATGVLLGNKRDYCMIAEGLAYQAKSASGVPVAVDSTTGLIIGCFITPESVNDYRDDSVTKAGLAVNANNGEYTSFSSWLSKMYFSRFYSEDDNPVSAGFEINHSAKYYVQLQQNNVNFD
jgi:hypothetical protein